MGMKWNRQDAVGNVSNLVGRLLPHSRSYGNTSLALEA